jgi:hypothetical protein
VGDRHAAHRAGRYGELGVFGEGYAAAVRGLISPHCAQRQAMHVAEGRVPE